MTHRPASARDKLRVYEKAINRIQDYIDYDYYSAKDRAKVLGIVEGLTADLTELHLDRK